MIVAHEMRLNHKTAIVQLVVGPMCTNIAKL